MMVKYDDDEDDAYGGEMITRKMTIVLKFQ